MTQGFTQMRTDDLFKVAAGNQMLPWDQYSALRELVQRAHDTDRIRRSARLAVVLAALIGMAIGSVSACLFVVLS